MTRKVTQCADHLCCLRMLCNLPSHPPDNLDALEFEMQEVLEDHTGDIEVGARVDVPVLSGSIDDLPQMSTRSSAQGKRTIRPVECALDFGDDVAGSNGGHTSGTENTTGKVPASSKTDRKGKGKKNKKSRGKGTKRK